MKKQFITICCKCGVERSTFDAPASVRPGLIGDGWMVRAFQMDDGRTIERPYCPTCKFLVG